MNDLTTPTAGLERYDAACQAIAEAKAVDEAKEIRDRSEAMRAYAKQAKNKQLEVDAAEIRIRAERRIGELMKAQKETVGLATGGQPYQSTGSERNPVDRPVTLAQVGINKSLANRARKLAAVPEDQFEEEIDEWRDRVSDENARVTTRLERLGDWEIRTTEKPECVIPEGTVQAIQRVCPTCGTVLYDSRKDDDDIEARVAKCVGFNDTDEYRMAKAVVLAAEEDSRNFGLIQDEMDETGDIKAAYSKLRDSRNRAVYQISVGKDLRVGTKIGDLDCEQEAVYRILRYISYNHRDIFDEFARELPEGTRAISDSSNFGGCVESAAGA